MFSLRHCGFVFLLGLFSVPAFSGIQDSGVDVPRKEKISRIRELGRRKADALPALAAYLKDPDNEVRDEAVRAMIRIGGPESLAPLEMATKDNSAAVQLRALDGLVNFYLPGYVPSGLTAPVTKGVRSAKSVVVSRNDQTIDPGVTVKPEVNQAVADLVSGGASDVVRREAARAAGILRDRPAVPALAGALRAHDNALIFESLVALQKIRPKADLPSLRSAARDLDERTQILALDTIGILHSVSSAPDIRQVLKDSRNIRVERAALEALAMLGQPEDRSQFLQYQSSSDVVLRTAALEGLGRTRDPEDYSTLEKAFNETNSDWRIHLAAAFALVNQGKLDGGEFGPLSYLLENASLKSHASMAAAYLAEVCRKPEVRQQVMPMINQLSRDGKLAICPILGETGDNDVEPILQDLTQDPSADVATSASKALRTLKARQS